MSGSASYIAKRGAVPLYHQIFLQLRDEIVSGARDFGATMPTEHELADQFRVSRITARRALEELAAHRLVVRKRRIGSTVVFRAPIRPIEGNIDQAVDTLIDWGHKTRVRVVEIGVERPPLDVSDALELAEGARVMRAMRVRSIETTPIGCVVSYVPEAMAGSLSPERLASGPILELLKDDGFTPTDASQTIAARVAEPAIAELLDVEPRAPLLQITRVTRDRSHRPFLMTIASYLADRYQIRVDLAAV